jgi:hypothetical protein
LLANRIEKLGGRKSRDYRSRKDGPAKNHGIKRADEIIAEACGHYKMDEASLKMDRRGDWRRSSVVWAMAKETIVPQDWIAPRLNLKSAANASQQIRRFDQTPEKWLAKEFKLWKLSRNVA